MVSSFYVLNNFSVENNEKEKNLIGYVIITKKEYTKKQVLMKIMKFLVETSFLKKMHMLIG